MTLKANSISVRIGQSLLLQDINLELKPGRFLGILGPNGAGKSTLLKILSGEMSPTHGSVELDQIPLKRFKEDALAKRRAVMPQASQLAFPFSARAVVAMGRWPYESLCTPFANQKAIEKAMALSDVRHLAERSYSVLSGGEKQRVQLARALAQTMGRAEDQEAKYLLLDEPTAGLDIAHQHAVLKAARQQCNKHNTATLAILHDLNQAALYCDDIAIISNGSLVNVGPTKVVMDTEILSKTFNCKVTKIHEPHSTLAIFTTSL
ncbi:heme ABC transporter ATP-binding protein [Kiloniella antarctica]|uniref:Heme ABC transporter ATP-binding protein n=1 Tax=Kiloniella antarctica TaxID=1550907 RepID=A0ABW5BQ10_9PROT